MSRYLLAGLFVLSLTICVGCGDSGGPAVAPDKPAENAGKITGMDDEKTTEGGTGKLPPPPPLPPIPPGNQ